MRISMQWAYSVSLLVFSVYVYHKFSEMKYNTVPIQGLGVMEEIENRKTTKTKLYEEHRLPCLPIDDHKDGIVCVSVRGSAFQMNLYILSNPCNVKWAKRATKKRTSKYQSQQKMNLDHRQSFTHIQTHALTFMKRLKPSKFIWSKQPNKKELQWKCPIESRSVLFAGFP